MLYTSQHYLGSPLILLNYILKPVYVCTQCYTEDSATNYLVFRGLTQRSSGTYNLASHLSSAAAPRPTLTMAVLCYISFCLFRWGMLQVILTRPCLLQLIAHPVRRTSSHYHHQDSITEASYLLSFFYYKVFS